VTVTADRFRDALACFPAGVTVVTTLDAAGRRRGFTASSFCSVSLDPPLVLVCPARSADSFTAFARCRAFTVNVLRAQQADVARTFATRGADKFRTGRWSDTGHAGLPALDDALCTLDCAVYDRHDAGDHVILVGEVRAAVVREGEPLVHFARSFR
jgi:flavin reductase ActVB